MPSETIVTCFPLSAADADTIRDAATERFEVIVANQETISEEIFKADIFCGHAKVPVDWDRVVNNRKLKWIHVPIAHGAGRGRTGRVMYIDMEGTFRPERISEVK